MNLVYCLFWRYCKSNNPTPRHARLMQQHIKIECSCSPSINCFIRILERTFAKNADIRSAMPSREWLRRPLPLGCAFVGSALMSV